MKLDEVFANYNPVYECELLSDINDSDIVSQPAYDFTGHQPVMELELPEHSESDIQDEKQVIEIDPLVSQDAPSSLGSYDPIATFPQEQELVFN